MAHARLAVRSESGLAALLFSALLSLLLPAVALLAASRQYADAVRSRRADVPAVASCIKYGNYKRLIERSATLVQHMVLVMMQILANGVLEYIQNIFVMMSFLEYNSGVLLLYMIAAMPPQPCAIIISSALPFFTPSNSSSRIINSYRSILQRMQHSQRAPHTHTTQAQQLEHVQPAASNASASSPTHSELPCPQVAQRRPRCCRRVPACAPLAPPAHSAGGRLRRS